ncbi:UDP-3-O-(3-hydroxymyristoyl)glucosamine N-acyltransferase [Acidipila sp. EB88]|uniref:UDP-3-O-(3-hydroxymyristoyl)glucosamine N-acyltransferase n=1 Tax=Acidipila sp. EB88 TaxID=2305226 RepID=UPI000F5E075A|nr:UDP-3-O-(3-hydroxymyristoyl)glucosamine N-acyltransferase [Acidipila sp. EB88]RRA49489.1 UDP-3-O-(3-hydroxymyristoyl)glucosamine N-acyltransferase [Acidipila sp. EB88]
MKLEELATALGAALHPGEAHLEGLPAHLSSLEITGMAGLETASPSEVSFVANPRYTAAAHATRAAAVLVEPGFAPLGVPTLRIKNPYLAFAKAVELFHQGPIYAPGIHPTAVVDPSARLADTVHVGPYVVVGPGVQVGAHGVLLAHVVLYAGVKAGSHLLAHAHAIVREGSILGDHVTLGNGAIIGSDGFGFARDEAGAWYKIPQSGHVIIGDNVEIQANSCIDRASIGTTTIAAGAKIDNLVQVGHGSAIGERTLLCSQVGLAGSSHIGKNVILAGQVGVAGHLSVGDNAVATAQTGIPNDVAAGETVSGYPAMANRQWLRASAGFARLPEILRRLARLEKAAAVDTTLPRMSDPAHL